MVRNEVGVGQRLVRPITGDIPNIQCIRYVLGCIKNEMAPPRDVYWAVLGPAVSADLGGENLQDPLWPPAAPRRPHLSPLSAFICVLLGSSWLGYLTKNPCM